MQDIILGTWGVAHEAGTASVGAAPRSTCFPPSPQMQGTFQREKPCSLREAGWGLNEVRSKQRVCAREVRLRG